MKSTNTIFGGRTKKKITYKITCDMGGFRSVSVDHYSDVIMSAMMSQITSFSIVYSTACSGTDQRKHQSSTSLAFVRGIHWWPVNSPCKGPLTWKMFPFDDIIMDYHRQTNIPDSKVHRANMGPIWVLSASDGPHVGPMNLAIWDAVSIHKRQDPHWLKWSIST